MLQLRPTQESGMDKLRRGFAAGHNAQIMYGPCGFGKTEVAIYMMDGAAKKNKRSAMILDRRILCEQTSQRLWKYGIDHGVIMQGTSRWRPDQKIQICTAQTLEKREGFPAVDLLIIDEAHCVRKETAEFIKNHPGIKVVGLSGSPFAKGLGAIYSNVESAVTIDQLVEDKWLVSPRVFIAKEIDMSEAKKLAGEWTVKDATTNGMKITGDIVSEWVAKTNEIFGGPRKTIVFCAGVAHGESLSRKFAEAGYNFVSISYKDDNEFKTQAIADFNQPDTDIHGLIATDILSKGFDCSDVMIGVSARPFSKSFSSHVQQIGRVMRPHEGKDQAIWLDHCIAAGQRVLTHRGLVAINEILLSDTIWDGFDFVSHKGAVSRGRRPVIEYAGITATADHLVKTTDEGWCSLGYCADKQKAIVTTGIGGSPVRECDDYFSVGCLAWSKKPKVYARSMRVRGLRISLRNFFDKLGRRKNKWLSSMQSAETGSWVAKRQNSRNAVEVQEQEQQAVGQLWWKGNRVQVRLCDFMRSLDSRELGMLGFQEGYGAGQDRQQRALRAWEHQVGIEKAKFEQSKEVEIRRFDESIQNSTSRNTVRGHIYSAISKLWNVVRSNSNQIPRAIQEAEREVWDILDCGPRNSFTCEGLLVHNSGNYLRFREDWDRLCSEGVSELDDGAEKPKPEPTKDQKDAAKCPVCSHLWPGQSDTCSHCGHVRVRRSSVIEIPGELFELAAEKKEVFSMEYKTDFYAQLIGYALEKGYKPGFAYWKYKDRFGVGPTMKTPEPKAPSAEVCNFALSRLIASSYAMKKRTA